MKHVVAILKWLLTAIMLLTLIFSLFIRSISYLGTSAKVDTAILPATAAELVPALITVKSILVGPSISMVTPIEYPTLFAIQGVMPDNVISEPPIQIGDKIVVFLPKGEANQLRGDPRNILPEMIGYGIEFPSGRILLDPEASLSETKLSDNKPGSLIGIVIPICYFLALKVMRVRTKHNRRLASERKVG